ncbi:hypothetical protein [Alteromonas sp. 14N.309.X.WAT.G.H12]|uniref:hypothetical protein n=1 Tax=Alteromonas sp. 14N.309.X.WAT.G.H12 TaxID=3120824 RepID=UPI002FD6AB51
MTITNTSLGLALVCCATLFPVQASTNQAPQYETCPTEFHAVDIPKTAKFCQRFESQEPATMVFFSPDAQQALIDHYKSAYPALKVHAPVQGRTVLTAKNDSVRIIVSPDSKGTQVDVMVINQDIPAKPE